MRPSPMLLALTTLTAAGATTAGATAAEEQPAAAVQQLLREGQSLLEGHQPSAAEEKLAEALRRSEQLGDRRLQARGLSLLGSVAEALGDAALGRERLARALELARASGDRTLEAKVHERVGRGCWARADYACARESYAAALDILRELGDRAGEASILDALGWVHVKQGALVEARAHFDAALAAAVAAGHRTAQALILRSLGCLAREQGDFRGALGRFEESLRIWKDLGRAGEELETIKEIGIAYALNGAPEDALAWYARALELARRVGDADQEASALLTMGRAHHRAGDAVRARACLEQALAIRERLGDPEKVGWCWSFLGEVHATVGSLDAAIDAYRRALAAWERVGALRPIPTLLVNLGEACLRKGALDEALPHLERAARAGEEIELPYRTLALSGLAQIRARRGENAEALAAATQAVELAQRCDMPGLEWMALAARARVERRSGQLAEASRSYAGSLDAIERLRRTSIAEDQVKAGFLEDKQVVYEEALALAIEQRHAAEALLIAERARARAFVDLLSGRELPARPVDRQILEQVLRLEESIRRGEGPAPAPGGVPGTTRGAGPASASRGALEKLRAEHSALVSLVAVPPLSLPGLLDEARRRRATLVEYFTGEEQLFVWVVGPDGSVASADAPIGRVDLERLIGALREDLSLHLEKSDPLPALRRLHELLIQPIAPWLPREVGAPVIVIPHRDLFLVSFAALLDGEGKFLVERHTLSVAPAVSVLEHTRRRKARVADARESRVLAVGNPLTAVAADAATTAGSLAPLPGAELEVRSLARHYPADRLTVLTGAEASEGTLRALAPAATVLHLATHAILRDDALASLVALAPGGGSGPDADGGLTVREVFALDLRADLVVLSACNTALGKITGDGVTGLSRAFIQAGAASVVVSLWRVADLAALPLMDDFYRALEATGGDKAAALREAQLHLLERLRRREILGRDGRPLRPHPIHWAPFVLLGEPR